MLDGVLVIDKPAGMTSAQVVARVKSVLGAKRVGHTGTLDPMATGVLPICVGEATKIAGYLLAEDKCYDAELELGVTTDTQDAQGQVLERAEARAAQVTEAEVRERMAEFVGPGEQVPPMYSALKHQGQRLHELARRGQEVERSARPIHIHALEPRGFALPRVSFSVHCSKGTYVRTLAADLGQRLGCGAHLTALRRTRSGAFTLDQAVPLAWLEEPRATARERALPRLVSPADALSHLACVDLEPALVARVATGQPLPWSTVARDRAQPAADEVIRLLDPSGALLALAQVDPGGRIQYARVFKGNRLPT